MSRPKTLVFIPTYNESRNVVRLLAEILALALDLDVLFIDDASPDGTGRLLDRLASENSRVKVIHRSGKLGIGSAHKEGIRWAYERGYASLVTMDCDFTHPPAYLPDFLSAAPEADVLVGSRYLRDDSLRDWDWLRLFVTHLGHFMTKRVLGIPADATSAYRLYRLDRIPRQIFEKVASDGYSFFFESLFVLLGNGFDVRELPITLPARTRGYSKMRVRDAVESARRLLELSRRDPERFLVRREAPAGSFNTGRWNANAGVLLESRLARWHRRLMLRATRFHDLVQDRNAALLDLGCGSGPWLSYFSRCGYKRLWGLEPDPALIRAIPAGVRVSVRCAEAGATGLSDAAFDAVFVYCVLYHLKGIQDYREAVAEIHRILKPGGHVFVVEPGRYRLFLAMEAASWLLGTVSKTFRAFYATMEEERPEQHLFLKNHGAVREGFLKRNYRTIVDDYLFYSWIFTAQKS